MLLSNQTDIDGVTPMPTDRVDDTSVVLPITSETLTWFYLSGTSWASATGQAAGTIVYGKTAYDGILNSSKSALGGNADTSVSFGASTRVSQRINVPSGVLSKIERMTPANQKAAMAAILTTAGDYIVDHRRGRVWANMKATVADDAISYSVKSTATSGTTDGTTNITKVGGVSVLLDGATYTPGTQYLLMTGQEVDDPTALATETEGKVSNLKGDLSGRLITTAGTLSAGEDLTNNLLGTLPKPIAGTTYTGTRTQDLSFTTLNLKATAGNVLRIEVTNTTASTRWFQLHNTATVPSGGNTAQHWYLVPANSQIILGPGELSEAGLPFTTGIAYANSTVASTYTAGSAGDLLLNIRHI